MYQYQSIINVVSKVLVSSNLLSLTFSLISVSDPRTKLQCQNISPTRNVFKKKHTCDLLFAQLGNTF